MVGLTDSQKPGSIIQVPKLQPISEAGGPTPVIYSHHLLSASQRGDGSNLQERARPALPPSTHTGFIGEFVYSCESNSRTGLSRSVTN